MRQLQYCVTERGALDCVELYASEQRRGATGSYCREAHKSYDREMGYQRKAETILNDENCFKVYIVCAGQAKAITMVVARKWIV